MADQKAKSALEKKGVKSPPPFPYDKYITTAELIMLRNYFYYDSYRRLMRVFLWLLVVLIILIGTLFYERAQIPTPIYFATTTDGYPVKLLKLKEPNLQPAALLEWAVEAATESYSFNFVNYRKALQNARIYFTRNGYENFLEALKASNNLIAVKNRKLVVSARKNGEAIILKDSSMDPNLSAEGAYTWQVQVPMILTYQSAAEEFVQNIVLTMVITRVSMLESLDGLGIDSFIVREVV